MSIKNLKKHALFYLKKIIKKKLTVAIRIVIVSIIRVVDNEIIGRTKLALKIKRRSIVLVSASTTNLAHFCWRRVLI